MTTKASLSSEEIDNHELLIFKEKWEKKCKRNSRRNKYYTNLLCGATLLSGKYSILSWQYWRLKTQILACLLPLTVFKATCCPQIFKVNWSLLYDIFHLILYCMDFGKFITAINQMWILGIAKISIKSFLANILIILEDKWCQNMLMINAVISNQFQEWMWR